MNTELLTVSQTAAYLQLSEKTIRRLIEKGSLRASKLSNRSWRILSCDIDDYVKSQFNTTNNNKIAVGESVAEPIDVSNPDLAGAVSLSASSAAPKLISLFSGCGGLDCGFKKAGFDIVWANDFDSDAQAVYELNLGKIDKRDILTVDENEIPHGDILTAGFPCQPFSNAGNRKGVHDSRGMLYKEELL